MLVAYQIRGDRVAAGRTDRFQSRFAILSTREQPSPLIASETNRPPVIKASTYTRWPARLIFAPDKTDASRFHFRVGRRHRFPRSVLWGRPAAIARRVRRGRPSSWPRAFPRFLGPSAMGGPRAGEDRKPGRRSSAKETGDRNRSSEEDAFAR